MHTHHVGQVGCPVELGVRGNDIPPLVCIAVDEGGNSRQLGNDIDAVLQDWLPVVELVDALGVGSCKLAVGLQTHTHTHTA